MLKRDAILQCLGKGDRRENKSGRGLLLARLHPKERSNGINFAVKAKKNTENEIADE